MVQNFTPHPALSPFVEGFLAMSQFFERESQQMLSARGLPMLVFPFKQPASTTIRHGHEGGTYPKPMMDEPALLFTNNVFCQSNFLGVSCRAQEAEASVFPNPTARRVYPELKHAEMERTERVVVQR